MYKRSCNIWNKAQILHDFNCFLLQKHKNKLVHCYKNELIQLDLLKINRKEHKIRLCLKVQILFFKGTVK